MSRAPEFAHLHEPDDPADERMIGQLAVDRGYVSIVDVDECIAEQMRQTAEGRRTPLGQLLVRRGHLSESQYLDLLAHRRACLRVCPACAAVCDAAGHPAEVSLRCLRCGEALPGAPEAGPRSASTPHIGKYEIRRELGRGGAACVYEAYDPHLRRRVALKILSDSQVGRASVERLHREAAIAAQLEHGNIVRVHEVGVVPQPAGGALHFIAMEYVEGRTLADLLAARHDVKRVVRLLSDLARAVDCAHRKGIVHRDIKPSNVLVDTGWRPMLADFGLARAGLFDVSLTASHAILGTPMYMAPEQVRGEQTRVTAQTDVYALGIILYEVLTGRTPYEDADVSRIFQRILLANPKPPRAWADVPRELEAVCLKAIEAEPRHRYASAADFAEDLSAWLRGDPVSAYRAAVPRAIGRWITGHRARLALGAALLVATLAVLFVMRASTASQARRAWKVAQEHLTAGRWLEARDACLEVLKRDPHHAGARTGLLRTESVLALARSERDAAAPTEAAAALLTNAHQTLYDRNTTPAELRRTLEKASRELDALARQWPEAHGPAYHLGHARLLDGDWAAAERCWRRCVELRPDSAQAQFELGRVLMLRAVLASLGVSEADQDERQAAAVACGEEAVKHLAQALEGLGRDDPVSQELARSLVAYLKRDWDACAQTLQSMIERLGRRHGVEGFHWVAGLLTPQNADHFTAALAVKPHDPLALFCRGIVHDRRGDPASAHADYTKAVELAPAFADAWYNLACVNDAQGRRDDALRAYDAALLARPGWPSALINRALCRLEAGAARGAEADIASLDASAGPAVAAYGRARLCRGRGDKAQAIRHLDEAIRLKPRYAAALYLRGTVRLTEDDFARADEDYTLAIECFPRYFDALANRGASRLRQRRHGEAIIDFDEALRLRPGDPDVLHNRSRARFETEDFAGAVQDATAAMARRPDDPELYYFRACGRLRLGQVEAAVEDYRRALALNGQFVDARFYLASALDLLKRPAEAITELDRALRDAPAGWTNAGEAQRMLAKLRR